MAQTPRPGLVCFILSLPFLLSHGHVHTGEELICLRDASAVCPTNRLICPYSAISQKVRVLFCFCLFDGGMEITSFFHVTLILLSVFAASSLLNVRVGEMCEREARDAGR